MRLPNIFGQLLSMISPSFNDNVVTLKTSAVEPGNISFQCLFLVKGPKALQISRLCSCELQWLCMRSWSFALELGEYISQPFALGSGSLSKK